MSPTQTRRLAALNGMLNMLDARCMWSMPGPENTSIVKIECFMVGQRLVLVEIFEEGFEYFLQGQHMIFANIVDELGAIKDAG